MKLVEICTTAGPLVAINPAHIVSVFTKDGVHTLISTSDEALYSTDDPISSVIRDVNEALVS